MARETTLDNTPVSSRARVDGRSASTIGNVGRIGPDPIRFLVVLALAIGLAGCQTYNVQTDWDASIAFDGLQRFHFVEPPVIEGADPFADNSLLRKRVRFAVETVLEDRGFRLVESPDEADFLVTYAVILDDQVRVDGISSSAGGLRRRGIGVGHVYSTTNVRAYQESTLILDLLDPSSEELLWRGWGTGIVGTRSRDRRGEQMEQGVRAILEKFPPPSDSADD